MAAFRALPGAPLFGRASRLRLADGRSCPLTQVLSWLDLVEDQTDRKFLATWARCRAEGESFAARCVGMGWKQSTAERGRRRALAAISAALALHGSPPAAPTVDLPLSPLTLP